jgi:hypothetical protein
MVSTDSDLTISGLPSLEAAPHLPYHALPPHAIPHAPLYLLAIRDMRVRKVHRRYAAQKMGAGGCKARKRGLGSDGGQNDTPVYSTLLTS